MKPVFVCVVAIYILLNEVAARPPARRRPAGSSPKGSPGIGQKPPGLLQIGPALRDFIDTSTGGDNEDEDRNREIMECVREHVAAESPPSTDKAGRTPTNTDEEFIIQMMVHRYPGLMLLMECFLVKDLVPRQVIDGVGGHMLFLAAAQFGSSPRPYGFFDALMQRHAPMNFTLGGPDDEFNVLHKIMDRHKVILMDVAGRLLRLADPKIPEWYGGFLLSLGQSMAALLPKDRASKVQYATQHLVDSGRVSPEARLGNHTVYRADIEIITDNLSLLLAQHAIPKIASVDGDKLANNRSYETPFHKLVGMQDKFGRTPLHMAVMSARSSLPHLVRQLLATAPYPPLPEEALRLIVLQDNFGYSPRKLAEVLGHETAADVLQRAEELLEGAISDQDRVDAAYSLALTSTAKPCRKRRPALLQVPPPRATEFASFSESTEFGELAVVDFDFGGGWREPVSPSALTEKAISEAAQQTAVNRRCDVDVIDPTEYTASQLNELFVTQHLIPNRPVILRGMMLHSPLRHAWTVQSLIRRHGNTSFEIVDIPYAASFGMRQTTLTLAEFISGLFYCTPTGTMNPPDSFVRLLKEAGTDNFLTERHEQSRICTSFRMRAPSGEMEMVYRYIFSVLDKPQYAALRADLGLDMLPSIFNVSLPTKSSLRALKVAADGAVTTADSPWRTGLPVIKTRPEAPLPQFYIGAKGSGAPMHYHEDAINFMVYGRKTWYLYPPEFGEYSTIPIASYVTNVLPKLPKSKRPIQCTQQEGDVMYVPREWGHAVLNTATSVGYALEFSTPLQRY